MPETKHGFNIIIDNGGWPVTIQKSIRAVLNILLLFEFSSN